MSPRNERILALFQKKLSTLKLDKISESDLQDPEEKEIAEYLFEALEELDVGRLKRQADAAGEPCDFLDVMYDEWIDFLPPEDDTFEDPGHDDEDLLIAVEGIQRESLDPKQRETLKRIEQFKTQMSRLKKEEREVTEQIRSKQREARDFIERTRQEQKRLSLLLRSIDEFREDLRIKMEMSGIRPRAESDEQHSQLHYRDQESSQQMPTGQLSNQFNYHPGTSLQFPPQIGTYHAVARSPMSLAPETSMKNPPLVPTHGNMTVLDPKPQTAPGQQIQAAPRNDPERLSTQPPQLGLSKPVVPNPSGFWPPSEPSRNTGFFQNGMSPHFGTSTKLFPQPAMVPCQSSPTQQPYISSTTFPYCNPGSYWQQGPYGAYFAPPPFPPSYPHLNPQTAGPAPQSLKPHQSSTFYQPYL